MQSLGLNPRASVTAYWSLALDDLLAELPSSATGLGQAEADRRLKESGANSIRASPRIGALTLLLSQFKSPLVLILVFAAVISLTMGEWADAGIVLVVVFGSTVLAFVQEYRAGNAVDQLRSRITVKARVLRDGSAEMIPADQVVRGDVVLVSAGSLIPADGVVLEANDFFVNQAVLTGETFPVEKIPGVAPANATLAERSNSVFMGTSVGSGTARVLIASTGSGTVFGGIAGRLSLRPEETEFERGIRRFGGLLTQVMLVMVVVVLAANVYMAKPLIDSLLFALALAVGLTPELLPAIISITLSYGAQRMAKRGVIVRRLNAIENLGSMDVLCTDKTGTLTEGVVRLDGALDPQGQASNEVLRFAHLNAHFQTGLDNAIDDAIRAFAKNAGSGVGDERKVDEIPYDFVRKRLSVVTADAHGARTLITKGALDAVLGICANAHASSGDVPLDAGQRATIERQYAEWSEKGFRVLGIATRRMDVRPGPYSRSDETGLTFAGFLLFFDPPKADTARVIVDLAKRGVGLKIITGDNVKVAMHIADAVHLKVEGVKTGHDLADMRDEALWNLAERTTIFAEVDPNQKERIILALQKTGHVVGYMGDGINDAPALHAADVGISVNTAVDVAKASADFVLLERDLGVLLDGIDEGRRTFANTLKYILTTISANFGNMFSMALASVCLPFLPLLAPQILLNNFLSDIPGTTIATDNVDPDMVERPRRWNMRFIRDYMVIFGFVSSIFDLLTFAILLFIFRASAVEFQTGWFVESLLTELVIALVVRTRRPFFRSRPGALLLWSTVSFIAITIAIPYLPFSSVFGFIPLPAPLMFAVVGLTLLYVVAVEATKKLFYAHVKSAAA
ncbi:MAG: magnesium-translocating P-type ATPase [Vicinamibacteria bacterium]